ncbi:uncharacterized protein LOC124139987 isoform X2 [Haliotis rufescens]|uniref:uncharacterized protein LOC124139987 isoform X2 n=1 Tax=Haliotis rufescens TaxID=6454 RepID=UPI00201EA07A|nr:uncharacterized protein LOC124139987 isoform X2 [Haliotis rufescens]
METSVIVWQCITIFCYILQPVCTATTHTSKACYGSGEQCVRHGINCSSSQKIAIYDAYYTNNTDCDAGISSCSTVNLDNVTEQGYHRFNNTELVSLYNYCSTENQCVYVAPRRGAALTFSVVKYQCIEKIDLLNISGGVAVGLSQVSLIHGDKRIPSSTPQTNTYVCTFKSNVTATSISVYTLDARSGRGTSGQCLSKLSVLPGDVITTNNCSTPFIPFERLNVTAELPVSLHFSDIIRPPSTLVWLLINASVPFNMECETDTVTSTESSAITTTNNIVSTVTRENDTGTADQSEDDTGAIIGGVVATVLVVLVVTLVSVGLIRKRQAKREVMEETTSIPQDVQPDMTYSLAGKIPQNKYNEIQDLKTQNSNYDYTTAGGIAIPTNADTYFIIEPAGKQNTEQFSTSSTTECDYDHIGDKQSLETSEYDTTASVAQSTHTGGTIGEDNYGYNLFHKKTNPQTHQNDYDTAASATKAVAQLTRTDRNTDDDDYDHFPRVTNDLVSSPYDTASGMEDNYDHSVTEQMK